MKPSQDLFILSVGLMLKRPCRYYWFTASSLALSIWIALSEPVPAQITPDGMLQSPTQVITPDNRNFTIVNGQRVGPNLFHSFSQFSVPTDGLAFFNNPVDIQNIIGRVTGSSISTIDGVIRANGTANVFLLNPNGLRFGPNASLNLGGSFLASTASSLHFEDGTEFRATAQPSAPLLTMSAPVGLQFGDTAHAINVQGASLAVAPGQTLALVGGDIALTGEGLLPGEFNLAAPGGRIELGSVASQSNVSLTFADGSLTLGFETVEAFQDISLSEFASIDVTDQTPLLPPSLGIAEIGSGDVQLQGQRISLTDGSSISSFTLGAEPAGTLVLSASESIELSGTGEPTPATTVSSNLNTVTFGSGAGGNIDITTPRLVVREGAGIASAAFSSPFLPDSGQGASGNITITASESVEVSGTSAIALAALRLKGLTVLVENFRFKLHN